MKPICLDLYCKAGGTSRGYQQAGFYVVGVDIEPQKNYIGDDFLQADALEVLRILIGGGCIIGQSGRVYYLADFDLIAASPPCQLDSVMTPMAHRQNHPDLIEPTRELLLKTGRPFVIENVSGARHKLLNPVMLCGSMFGLPIWRHRYFETYPIWLMSPAACCHDFKPVLITDNGGPNGNGWGKPRKRTPIEVKRRAIQIDWMVGDEITEAIPPAYTRYLGQKMIELIKESAL